MVDVEPSGEKKHGESHILGRVVILAGLKFSGVYLFPALPEGALWA